MIQSHIIDLERKREEQEIQHMMHEEKHMRQYIESVEIKKRMARSRREAKMIIDEMKDDISGMYEMQKRAMGLGEGGAENKITKIYRSHQHQFTILFLYTIY